MNPAKIKPLYVYSALLLAGVAFIALAMRKPISDFGNYYYGAKIISQPGGMPSQVYDVMAFNGKVQQLGVQHVFLNHCTVTPQSLLFYQSVVWIGNAYTAKTVFGFIGLLLFIFSLRRFLLRYQPESSWRSLLLIAVCLVPVYYNIVFGQTYLLIAALLMETVLHAEERPWLSGVLLSVAVSLKVSPAFLLIWLLSEKRYKAVAWTIACWMLFFFGTALLHTGMLRVLLDFYTQDFPRIGNGFIHDPFSSSLQGFVVFLRKLLLSDAILNPHALIHGNERIVQLLNVFFFIAAACVLVGAWKRSTGPRKKILLLLLLLNCTSGYTSTYALLLLVPFIDPGTTRRDWLRLMLYAIVICGPSRLFDGMGAFAEEYKLWLFIALFIIEAKPSFGFRKLEKPQLAVAALFLLLAVGKIAQRPEELPLEYYHPERVKQDYVLAASPVNSSLLYLAYEDGGFNRYAIPIEEEWGTGNGVPERIHGVRMVVIGKNNEHILLLSDYHRGPGLYHVYTMPVRTYEALKHK